MTGPRSPAASIAQRIDATVVHLIAPRKLELRSDSLQTDALGPTELLCETLVTAISPGTEIAAYTGLPPLRAGVAYPRLQGYCNVGRVLAAGSGVVDVRPGDRILTFTSHRSHFVIPREDVLVRLPVSVRSEDAACTYLFHLGYNAVIRSNVRAGSRVLVIGLGTLGLTSVAMAAVAGARVFAISDQPHAQRLATQFGARQVFSRADLQSLRSALTETLADVVIATTNAWADWEAALHLAGQQATLACLGFPGRGQAPPSFNPLDSQYFYARQLRIESVGLSPERADGRGFVRFSERENLAYLLELIANGTLQPAAIVSGHYEGRRIEQAYEDLISRAGSPITYLLRWNAE